MSKRSYEFSDPNWGENNVQSSFRSKRNRILSPRETEAVQVFAKVPPGTNGHMLVDFLNYLLKNEGMIEHERDGIITHRSLLDTDACWCLEMSSETLAEQLCYFSGVSLNEVPEVFITLHRHSSYSDGKPRFTGWNSYYQFTYNRNSPEVERCVYGYTASGLTDAAKLREMLNETMKDHFYAFIPEEEHDAICSCFQISGKQGFYLYLSTADLAEKLLWLDGIKFKDLKVHLSRHKEYRGPSPKYPSFDSFRQSREYKFQVEVFVHQKPSKNTGEELFDFLTSQLRNYRFVSEGETLIVDLLDITKTLNTWKVIAANPKIACILAYFDHVRWNGTELRIKRDRDYKGPPPRFRYFRDLRQEYGPFNRDNPPSQELSGEYPETKDDLLYQRSSKEHPETLAFVHGLPECLQIQEVIDFLNTTMISEGFTNEKSIVNFCQVPGRKDLVVLEMASGKLAEHVNYLCGIQMPGTSDHINVSRSKQYKKPKYTSWVEYKTNSDAATLRIELLHPRLGKLHQVKNFLHQKLKHYGLAEGEECSVFKCWWSTPSSDKIMLEMCNPDLADKIMYLQGMEWKDGTVMLNRHYNYKGPPPRYSSFREFQAAMTVSSAKQTGKNATSDAQSQASLIASPETKDGKTNYIGKTTDSEAAVPSSFVDRGDKSHNAATALDGEQRSFPSSVVKPVLLQKQMVVDLTRPPIITPEKASQQLFENNQVAFSDAVSPVRADAGTFARRVSQTIEQDIGIGNEKERGSERTESASKSSVACSKSDDEVVELRYRAKNLSNELETTKNKVTEVTGELSIAKSCLKVVTGRYEENKSQLAESADKLADAKSHLNDVTSQNEAAQKKLTEITGLLATTNKERDDLQSRLIDVNGQFDSAQKQSADVTCELATTKKLKDDLQGRLTDVTSKLKTAQTQLFQVTGERATAEKQRDDVKGRLTNVTSKLETAQNQLVQVTGELATASRQRDEINKDWGEQCNQLTDKQEEINILKKRLEESENSRNNLFNSLTLQNRELNRERNTRMALEAAVRKYRGRAVFTQNTPFHQKKEEDKNSK